MNPEPYLREIILKRDLVKDASQFIIATHSPILLSYPRARIYHLGDEEIQDIQYQDTEHFAVTRDFLNNHEKMLDILLDERDTAQE